MSQELAEAVAAEVRRRMEEVGWSGRELARRTGIASNTLAVKLRGRSPFDVSELADVAAVLGVDVATITAAAEAAVSRAR